MDESHAFIIQSVISTYGKVILKSFKCSTVWWTLMFSCHIKHLFSKSTSCICACQISLCNLGPKQDLQYKWPWMQDQSKGSLSPIQIIQVFCDTTDIFLHISKKHSDLANQISFSRTWYFNQRVWLRPISLHMQGHNPRGWHAEEFQLHLEGHGALWITINIH